LRIERGLLARLLFYTTNHPFRLVFFENELIRAFPLIILKNKLYFGAIIVKKKLGNTRYNVIITNNYLIEDQPFSILTNWIIIVSSDPHKISSSYF